MRRRKHRPVFAHAISICALPLISSLLDASVERIKMPKREGELGFSKNKSKE
jgi:hypothetical protein